jgi:hypothetical protein
MSASLKSTLRAWVLTRFEGFLAAFPVEKVSFTLSLLILARRKIYKNFCLEVDAKIWMCIA